MLLLPLLLLLLLFLVLAAPISPDVNSKSVPGCVPVCVVDVAGLESGAESVGEDGLPGKRKPSAFLGLGSSRYDGSHSEGNRFIADNVL